MKHLKPAHWIALLLTCQLSAHAADLSDPTQPPLVISPRVGKVVQRSSLKLDGIVNEVAIINGKLVRSGEWIGDARIDVIARDCVHYTRAGSRHVLRLAGTTIKVRHSGAVREDKR